MHVVLENEPDTAQDNSASEAFRVLVLAAAQRVIEHALLTLGGAEELAKRFPFLLEYANAFSTVELQRHPGLAQLAHHAGWPAQAIEVWLVCGLVEEDVRFAQVFEALDEHAQHTRPGMRLMQSWWGTLPREGIRPCIRALDECGVLEVCNPGSPFAERVYEVDQNCWAAARGEAPRTPAPGVRLSDVGEGVSLAELVLPEVLSARIAALVPRLQATASAGSTLIVRGPPHNGRRSLLAAIAHAEGRSALHIEWPQGDDRGAVRRWLGAFATLADARPIFHIRSTPGEAQRLLDLPGYVGWVGVACGDDDAFEELPGEAWSVQLPLPAAEQRRALIARKLPCADAAELAALADRLHLSSGHLIRALSSESAQALCVEERVERVRESALASGSAALDTLARRQHQDTGPCDLVLAHDLERDLEALETRCRQRERLREAMPVALGERLSVGVRALFAGPSGTGKSFAARALASRLGMPLYRLDLSAVVSKYIGETERNLQRLFDAAESLDVLLLLDEGDALLAKRTDVGNAHDRYANLETNFLLQRLESHRGLVIVTTNALERIDSAFLRRFDHLLHFRSPDVHERAALWSAHLPDDHVATERCIREVAEACELSGGQIRNVALAAASAALAGARAIDDALLVDALRHEYRRSGALCPIGRT